MDANLITLIGIILSFLIGLGSLVLGLSNRRYEVNNKKASTDEISSETILNLQKAVQQEQERAQRTEQRFTDLERKLSEKDAVIAARDLQIESLMDDIKRKERTIEQLTDWAERLVHQVQSLGETPVQFEKTDRVKPVAKK